MFLLVLVAAPVAHAGTVTLTSTHSCECDDQGGTEQDVYELHWTADPGEANTATVSWSANAFHLKDTTAPVAAGPGCIASGVDEATCRAPADCQTIYPYGCHYEFNVTLDGGDGDDVLAAGPLSAVISAAQATTQGVSLQLNGGDGNDTLEGTRYADVLRGGAGSDALHGGDGQDVLAGDGVAAGQPDAPPSADVIEGGPDADWVSYRGRTASVAVDLAAGRAGEANEGDQLSAVENVDGGGGDDVLTGDAGHNELWGGDGADRIDGGPGTDELLGGAGPDELRGSGGDDVLRGDGMGDIGFGPPPSPPPAAGDLIDGGDGVDTASWDGRSERIVVDLSDPGPDGEPAAPDTLTRIENVQAGSGRDTLIGDDGPNVLDAGSARGTVIGKGGDDTLLVSDTSGTVDAGPGDDLIRAGAKRLTCGAGFDRVSPISLALPKPDCEAKVFMADGWDPIRAVGLTPLLELRNAPARMTPRTVILPARCPQGLCRGTLSVNPRAYGRNDGSLKLKLRAGAWRTLRIPLSATGRRRAARHRRLTVWLAIDQAGYWVPVELKRARR